MHDYPGQGSAPVGWLDAFYEEKGFLTADEFIRFGCATVPLARLPKFVFTDDETLNAKAEVAHYGAEAIINAKLEWTLVDESKEIVSSGKFLPVDLPVGSVTKIGNINCRLKSPTPKGTHLVLEFTISGTTYANKWDIWVFPKPDRQPEPKGTLL